MPAARRPAKLRGAVPPDALELGFHCVRSAAGRLPDAMNSAYHCVRTHWIRGFMAFQLARHARTVMLMVLAWE